MTWMKYTACYKHGYGRPEWVNLGDCTPDQVEDLFEEHDREHGDPEGFRTGKYEVHPLPPIEVLEAEIKRQAATIRASQAYLLKLNEMLATAQNNR